MVIADLIRDHSHQIATEWASEARRGAVAPGLVLFDHMPYFLAELVSRLQRPGGGSTEGTGAQAHAVVLRLEHDFDLREVVREYQALRRVLLRRVQSADRASRCVADVARVDVAIDAAIAEAVDLFSKNHDRPAAAAEEGAGRDERFIATVSHDLRNPLNAIVMGVSLLLRSRELPPALGEVANRVLANANRMTRLIADWVNPEHAAGPAA